MKGVKGELPDEMGKAGARQLKNGSPREKKRDKLFSHVMIVNAPTLGRKKKREEKENGRERDDQARAGEICCITAHEIKEKKKSLIDRFYHFAQY